MPTLVAVTATARAQEGKVDELGQTMAALIEPSRKDEGCLVYELHRSNDDPSVWMMYELWGSADLLNAHLATPHLQAFLAATADLVDGELDLRTFTPVSR